MEWSGVKVDFIGLAAVIAAIATLYSKIKAHNKKKDEKHDTENHIED